MPSFMKVTFILKSSDCSASNSPCCCSRPASGHTCTRHDDRSTFCAWRGIFFQHLSDKETVVSCHNWTVMHDERNFSNPESFIPERWIESERGNETCVKEAFIAFQQGRRNCVGKPYHLP